MPQTPLLPMYYKRLPVLFTLMALTAYAVDWKPSYEDKPVSAEQKKLIIDALPDAPVVSPQKPRKVLLFSATSGFRHRSIPHGKLALALLGERTGAYDIVISDDPANFEQAALMEFDAVILLSPTLDFFMPGKEESKQFTDQELEALQSRHDRLVRNLVEYVKNGGGIMGIHAATDSCYHDADYGKMIGGYFNGHPWRAKNNVTIVVEDPQHETMKPVFGDIASFGLQEEIYQFKDEPYSRERLRVLLHLDLERSDEVKGLKRTDNDYPVAWVQQVGDGRVFYTSIGHNEHIYWNPLMLEHYLAGIQFACGDLKADTTPSAFLHER